MADNNLLEKFENIRFRFDEVSHQITDPNATSDMKRYVKLNQEYRRLEDIVNTFQEYKNIIDNISSTKELLLTETDEEMRDWRRKTLLETS